MSFLFKKKETEPERDTSVAIAKYTMPVLVYFPIIVAVLIVSSFIGLKLVRIARTPEGLAGYFNGIFAYFFGIKQILNKFIARFWPEPNETPMWKHIRIDTILLGLGSTFILLMMFLYNYDKVTYYRQKLGNLIMKIINPIMGFFMPSQWFKIKRNISLKKSEGNPITFKDYPFLLGGTALLLGFLIFLSLLVNNFNDEHKKTNATQVKDVFFGLIETTTRYLYMIVFAMVALSMFAGLLYYAATTDAAPKFLTTLLTVISTIIILAAVMVIFKDKLKKMATNPFLRALYHGIFILPCLFLDIVNYIYYELKGTPNFVYFLFLAEISIIASMFLVPMATKNLYLYKMGDTDKKRKLEAKIESLKEKKIIIQYRIKEIYNYNPDTSKKPTEININSNSSSNSTDPYHVKVDYEVILKDARELKQFCINDKGKKPFGKLKLDGKLNIQTQKIIWDSIKTLSGWKTGYSSQVMRDKCSWTRKSKEDDSEWVKKYLGVEDKPPTIFKDIPMSSKDIKELYTSAKYKDLQDKVRKKRMILKSQINKDTTPIEYARNQLKNAYGIVKNIFDTDVGEASLNSGSGSVNKDTWDTIIKKNLATKNNEGKLRQLLRGIGFKSRGDCKKLTDTFTTKKCIREINNMVKHIQLNAPQLIKFNGDIDEVDEKLKTINDLKLKQVGILDKGVVLLADARYFRNKMILTNKEYFEKRLMDGDTYNYAVSCWVFIHSEPPSTGKAYTKFTKILDFNGEPEISYHALDNTLVIKSDKASLTPTKDDKNTKVVIYKDNKFKLQKWHNIVVNYVGGTVDVFLNGKLVGNAERIVPYKRFRAITAGEDDGISGGICNVMYYSSYLSNAKINANYELFKNKNPPKI